MSLLDYDGHDHYDTARMTTTGPWNSTLLVTSSSVTIEVGTGRGGSQCLLVNGDRPYVGPSGALKVLAPGDAKIYWGQWVKVGILRDDLGILAVVDGMTPQLTVVCMANGTFKVKRGASDNGVQLGPASTYAIAAGAEFYLEFFAEISPSAGQIRVVLDTHDIITLTTGLNTRNSANTRWDGIFCGPWAVTGASGGFPPFNIRYDDRYVLDGTTMAGPNPFNALLGPIWVKQIQPTADGFYTNFATTGSSSHFANVDEPLPNDDTDKNTGSNIGDRDSLQYVLPTGTVLATMLATYAKKNDAGSRKFVDFIRASGVDYDGTAQQDLTTSYQFRNLLRTFDPSTSAAWVAGATIEQGIKISN